MFSSCFAAFEKSFDDWTMILSSPLVVTFTQTKDLALPPISSATLFPWFAAKISIRKAFCESDWVIEGPLPWIYFWTLMIVHLTIKYHVLPLDHQSRCKGSLQSALHYPYLCHYLRQLNVLHTDLQVNAIVKRITLWCLHKAFCWEVRDCIQNILFIN